MKRKYLDPSIDFHHSTAKPEKQETNVLPSLPHWIKHRTLQTNNRKKLVMKINFLWTACLIAITGCDSPQNHHSRIESGETKTEKQLENLNFYGTYEGILPAADCEGIRTALTLNNDNTYVLRSEYIGEKDAIFESKGSYHFINGRLMELAQSSSNEKSYYKILDGSKVMLSDKVGTVNQGVLAEYYILKKK